jgi:hypothetical protein
MDVVDIQDMFVVAARERWKNGETHAAYLPAPYVGRRDERLLKGPKLVPLVTKDKGCGAHRRGKEQGKLLPRNN